MAMLRGLEPLTFGETVRHSSQLNYSTINGQRKGDRTPTFYLERVVTIPICLCAVKNVGILAGGSHRPQPFGGVKGFGGPRRIRTAILTLRGLLPRPISRWGQINYQKPNLLTFLFLAHVHISFLYLS